MVVLKKTLLLIVHGIGEQAPGETIDALTGGAVQELGLPGPIEGRTEMIAEKVEGSELLKLFPCTIRRTTVPATAANKLPEDQEILAGEVYWSDLSRAPNGSFDTAIDLLRTILGLGYLALENVDDSAAEVSPWSRRAVYLFVWIFFALIAPFNALLLIASISLLVDPFLVQIGIEPGQLPGTMLIAGMGGVVALCCLFWRAMIRSPQSSYMVRAFVAGLGGLAVLAALAALLVSWTGDAPWLEALRQASCRSIEMTTCWSLDHQDIALFAWGATLLMGIIWLGAVAILLALFVTSTLTDLGLKRTLLVFGLPVLLIVAAQGAPAGSRDWLLIALGTVVALALIPAARKRLIRTANRITEFFGQRGLIYLSLCNAMLILWMLITSALWALFSGVVQKLDGDEGGKTLLTQVYADYSGLLLSTMAYIMIAVAALVLVGVVPLMIRRIRRGQLAQDEQTVLDIWCGRLILNPVLNQLLFVLILWIAFGGLFQASKTGLDVVGIPYYEWNTDTLIGRLSSFHERVTELNVLAVAVTAFLGLAIYRGASFIAAALGVARDISIYSTRTLAGKPGPGSDSHYAQRERILARFRLVHDHLARQMDYDRLIVVSHSQGTVIAAQSLAEGVFPDRPRFLLTMGSPLTHIYGQYFAKGFGLDPLAGRLARWINIYRCDDFVGTQVRVQGGLVENLRVGPNGHTGYWTDRNVWSALRGALTRTDTPGNTVSDRDSPKPPLVA
ncbi:hypothetical protein CX676_18105 [Paracoccus zhejiangensis]|uniref:Uncharacterized protein n=1 Tax=Paracoccus zhejiangensis TaxID=1077935 RepID=A0A2H5F2R2_9RHOB|nr:hypothetical protein CX676_18105 [Paracoccus zhejiangensis]